MTYTVLSGTLNSTIPYHIIPYHTIQVTMVLSSPTAQASTAGTVTHRLRSSPKCYHDPLPGLDDVCNATDTRTHTFAVDFLERVVLHRLALFATSSVFAT